MANSVTLSSVGNSGTLILDYIGAKTTSIYVTLGSTSMTADFTVQATLDSSAATGSTPSFFGLSTTHYSSANADLGVFITALTPLAGLRITSTAISSSSITLKALQNAGG